MLTRKAAWILAASAVLWTASVAFQTFPAAVLGTTLAVLFAVNAFYVVAPGLEGELTVSSDKVSEDQRTTFAASIENPSSQPTLVERRLNLPDTFETLDDPDRYLSIDRGATRSWSTEVRPRLFGAYDVGPIEIRVQDPSGFRVEEHEVGESEGLLVRPRREELGTVPVDVGENVRFFGVHETSQPGDGFEFYTLRQWQQGDSVRSVNWRATARSDDLIVNQRARESYLAVAVLLDASTYAFQGRVVDSPFAECARGVTSLVEHLLDDRDEVQFRLLTDEVETIHPQAAERQLRQIMETLATTEPGGRFRWDEVVDDLLPTLQKGQPVVLASAFETDPSVVPAVKRLAAREHQILALSAPTSWPAGADDETVELRRRHRAMVKDEVQRVGGFWIELGQERPLSEAFLEAAMA